jgi:hypothetical protein
MGYPQPEGAADDRHAAVTHYGTHRGRAEDRRSAAVRAGALVAKAEPGFLDTFKESFAASRAVKAASPEVQKLVTGGLPEMPFGGKDEAHARTLELLRQAVGIMRQKAPQLAEEYRQVVLQSAKTLRPPPTTRPQRRLRPSGRSSAPSPADP